MRFRQASAAAFLVPLLAACGATGLLYRRTTEPLTTNFRSTPVGRKHAGGDIKHVHYKLDVMWDTNAIGPSGMSGRSR